MPKKPIAAIQSNDKVCGNCEHFVLDEDMPDGGDCYEGPPAAVLDPEDNSVCSLRPPVLASERACGRFLWRAKLEA